MFVREKRINGYTYLYLVETVREDGRAKQRIIKNLGRKEVVVGSGELERLAVRPALGRDRCRAREDRPRWLLDGGGDEPRARLER